MQPRRVYPRHDRAPVVADPRIPQQTPLLAVLKQPLHLLLSTQLEHLTPGEDLGLQAIETLQVVVLLDQPLEFVKELDVVEVETLLERA